MAQVGTLVNMPEDWDAAAREAAELAGTSKGKLMRDLLGKYLRRNGYELSELPQHGGDRKSENAKGN